MNESNPPQNVSELRDRLHTLGVDVSTRTLQRWAKQELIPQPDPPRGKGRGKGSISVWSERAICAAAGVWMIRGGLGGHWSRRILSKETAKKVQHVAAEMYTRPMVLLSLPEDTTDEDDPPLETVTFALDCPPNVEPFLFPYLIATEKARHSWSLGRAAVVSFEWAESAKGTAKGSHVDTRELIRISVAEAPHGKNELRFLVGGMDVRAYILKSRQIMRDLRASNRMAFEEQGLGIETHAAWPLASNSIRIGDETWEEVTQKYKKGEVPERERRVRLLWAYHLEKDTESDKRGGKSPD